MNETLASMNRYVPRYNPFTGESYSDAVYREGDAMGYLESWHQAMMDHYRGLGMLDEPEEEIDFSAPEWNNLVLN
jgi:hypothetical protein